MTAMALDLIAELHKIKKALIQAQAARDAGGKGICIMCMEADSDKCHRKLEIGRRLEVCGAFVIHI